MILSQSFKSKFDKVLFVPYLISPSLSRNFLLLHLFLCTIEKNE